MKRELLIFLLLVTTIQACMPIVGSESITSTQPVHTPTNGEKTVIPALPTQEPEKEGATMIQPTPSSNLEILIEKAKEDLARRLSISVNQIDLVEANEVVWPNASLGYPQQGLEYTQMQIAGYSVRLEAQGQRFEYHTDREQIVVFCYSAFNRKNPSINSDIDIDDGWPNETKDGDVITPTLTK